ncbi:MAG: DUF3791 domain-containing protein [Proteobacteria bacterium]|nr:DUF3791 domain-containing protein [Pseudomonadota bacterium]
MDNKVMEFVVFMIHALADAWNKPCPWVYQMLNHTGALDDYLIPCYDVLHTLGKEYLIDDITGYIKERGFEI